MSKKTAPNNENIEFYSTPPKRWRRNEAINTSRSIPRSNTPVSNGSVPLRSAFNTVLQDITNLSSTPVIPTVMSEDPPTVRSALKKTIVRGTPHGSHLTSVSPISILSTSVSTPLGLRDMTLGTGQTPLMPPPSETRPRLG
ncbi:predicted protein [Arabidopsis lyrata subsp. lyrata]|uniref:Predicted protein n=1 Tax=Arabidopsis lyrata subsp. lyrata TaxID=81972 RepID=D7MJ28_ARALL|nr:predicted protein [Arabidopsis lyrata subsp. lyrata]